jgi:hypothetical protein
MPHNCEAFFLINSLVITYYLAKLTERFSRITVILI